MKHIRESGIAAVFGLAGGLAGLLMILAGCAPAPQQPAAEAQPQFKGVVPINDIMVSVVDHNAHIVWNAADPKMAPKTDQDWHNLEHAATTLAAAGNMILIPGPPKDDQMWVKDPQWQMFAQDLANSGLKALTAVDHRDPKALEAAGDDLVVTCEACHKKFKPALPAHVAKPMEQPEHYHKATDE
jgi:cytochrome c556